jgi:hypothetical protein
MSADLERVRENSVPDSSIVGLTPTIEDIPPESIEQQRKVRTKAASTSNAAWKRCCVCGEVPTKIVKYPIQGATVVQRYCDACANKQFSRSSD